MAQVEAIHIAPAASVPMQSLGEVEAVAGGGLAGDRYHAGIGFYSPRPTDPGAREVTLFEAEVLEALATEHRITLGAGEHRRNLTTRGVRLDALLGRRFQVGEVLLEGVKDCPPCDHLQEIVGKPVLQPLVNRGGLRARVVVGGVLRVGDRISADSVPEGLPWGKVSDPDNAGGRLLGEEQPHRTPASPLGD
jgi:MOSC domain-containing protein YiiM